MPDSFLAFAFLVCALFLENYEKASYLIVLAFAILFGPIGPEGSARLRYTPQL